MAKVFSNQQDNMGEDNVGRALDLLEELDSISRRLRIIYGASALVDRYSTAEIGNAIENIASACTSLSSQVIHQQVEGTAAVEKKELTLEKLREIYRKVKES